ncbi:MAG: NADH-quinone oxidoreductase, chain, partial [Acidimicrobiales bacterium]|nr:NADH-quinone oxidoreductase, chain [Acidimicrobiales bacterium]
MPEQASETAVTITLNGKEIEARPGELLIAAAERHGVYIPRFCYHPRMKPVGMCRMCLVEVDTGRGPAIQPACMLPVAPDMKVATDSPTAKKVQEGVLEFLLINHPLDCPVCDKGGECPLQDHTISFGPGESRFVEEKRHFEKPIDISGTVALDRERCILCDRCTRFADEVAGDPLIHFQDRGGFTQVNTFPGHPFASYFSGNTVQICPVGALTAKPYRFKARPWDLEAVESTCTSCAVGCRVVIDGSRNEVLRQNGVDSDPVNWGWMCDKGRFDFQAVNSTDRLRTPLLREGGSDLAESRWSTALAAATEAIKTGLDRSGPAGLAVLGGARLSNESAYAWAKLAKGVLGTDNVDAQLGDGLPAEVVLGLPRATIDEAFAPGSTVVLLAPDLKEELPVLFLRLRHAVVNDGVKVVELATHDTGVTSLAAVSLRSAPGAEAELAQLIADGGTPTAGVDPAAAEAARVLVRGDAPVTVVLGRSSLADSGAGTVAAAAYLLDAIDGVRFLPALRRANVHGALDLGLAPGVLPGRVSLDDGRAWFSEAWPTVPAERGLDALGILTAAAEGRIDTLVLLGADPLADFPDRDLATRALAGARTVIATDLFLTDSVAAADIVFPAAGFAEVTGTTTNLEGRVTTLRQKVTPPGTAEADWLIAVELSRRLGTDLGLESAEDIWDEIEQVSAVHAGVSAALLWGSERADGVVVPLSADPGPATDAPLSDQQVTEGDPDEVTEAQAAPPADPDAPTGDPGDDAAAQGQAAAADSAAQAADDAGEAQAHHAEAA